MSSIQPQYTESGLVGNLTAAISASATTITASFRDKATGDDRTPLSSTKMFVIDKGSETFPNPNYEIILATAHSTTSGVTTLTGVTRSLAFSGSALTGGTGKAHVTNASIGCVDVHFLWTVLVSILDGTNSPPAFKLGTALTYELAGLINARVFSDSSARDAAITVPANGNIVMTNGVVQYYGGGVWNDFDSGTPTPNASTTVAGKVERATTAELIAFTQNGATGAPLFVNPADIGDAAVSKVTSAGAADSGKFVRLDADGFVDNTMMTYDATEAEIDQVCDGVSANVTASALGVLTAGAASNADAYHTHQNPAITLTAYEAITGGNAVALLPIEVQFYTQLTDANLSLGNSNTTRKYAVKIVPTSTTSSLTTMQFRAAEAVNGATTLGNLTISIQTDSASAPSGTAITNGTANVITQVTQRTWNTTQASRTATWATPPTLTAGTTYWIVWEVAATDGTNFLNLSVNSSHDESYLTFTRLTFNLDTASWGGSATDATPFFWFDTQLVLLGMAICPTDSDWGGRTWNFVGFASANISANAAGNIYTLFAPGLTLTPGLTYFLSGTPGAITTTPPEGRYVGATQPIAFTYKIGKAISNTTIRIDRGPKRVMAESATGGGDVTSTTVFKYVTWFRPGIAKVFASGSGVNGSAQPINGYSNGYVQAANTNDGINFYVDPQATSASSAGLADQAFNISSASGFVGVGSAMSEVGLTFTVTETNTATTRFFVEITE